MTMTTCTHIMCIILQWFNNFTVSLHNNSGGITFWINQKLINQLTNKNSFD